MAKRKGSTALFEVIAGANRDGVRKPSWIRPGDRPSGEGRASVTLRQPPGLDGAPPMARPRADVEPIIRIDGRHVRLTFGSVSGAIAVMVALLLLAGAYKVGRLVSHRAAAERTAPAGLPSVLGGGTEEPADYNFQAVQQAALARLPATGRILIVAEGVASMDDAQRIQQYLWSEGFMPYVLEDQTGRYAVLDTADLNTMTKEDQNGHRQALQSLGRRSSWQLRKQYDFSQLRETRFTRPE